MIHYATDAKIELFDKDKKHIGFITSWEPWDMMKSADGQETIYPLMIEENAEHV